MRKPDEIALAKEMCAYVPSPEAGVPPMHVRMGIAVKRWQYIISKWTRRGWLECEQSNPYRDCPRFNHTGYRYWSNVTSICESVDATCDSTGAYPTCCTPVLYGFVASFNGNIIQECTIPFLE